MTLDPISPVPLWAQLKAELRGRIHRGDWPPGTRLPSEVLLCETYGVSRITAARAIQELVREGLLQRQRGVGTLVMAPQPRPNETPFLTYVTASTEAEWMRDIFSGFEAVAASAGALALLSSTGGRPALDAEQLRTLMVGPCHGLAISHVALSGDAKALLPALTTRDGRAVPFTFVGTYDPTFAADRIVADNVAAGRLATEHLLSLGHRRIAFFSADEHVFATNTSLQGRRAGYRQALANTSLPHEETADDWPLELLDALPASLDDQARLDRLLAFLGRTGATAAVTTTDSLAVLLLYALQPAGITVPEHLALVGISDQRIAALAPVPLTTVRIDAAALGAAAAKVLLRRLDGDHSPLHEQVLPVQLVIRASCGARTHTQEHIMDDTRELLEAALS